MKQLFTILFLLLFITGSAFSQIAIAPNSTVLPTVRQAAWSNAGVVGGVQSFPDGVNVKNTPYNAYGDGVHDDTAAIQAAILACPKAHNVYLPTGIYIVSSTLFIGTNNAAQQHNLVLRGDGPQSTIISSVQNNNAATIEFLSPSCPSCGGGNPAHPVYVTNTVTQFSNYLANPSVGCFVGETILLSESNDPTFVTISDYGGGAGCNYCGTTGTNCPAQICIVTNVSGTLNQIALVSPPLLWNYNLNPEYWQIVLQTNCGLRDLTVTRQFPSTSSYGAMVLFDGCMNCWATNCEFSYATGNEVEFDICLQCTMQHCFIHDGWTQCSGQDYGVDLFGYDSYCLIEDSCFWNNRHALITEGSGSGSVFFANFVTNSIAGENANSFIGEGELTHAAHAWFILWEENVVDGIFGDYAHGSASHQTHFRENAFQNEYLQSSVIASNQWASNYVGLQGHPWTGASTGNNDGVTGTGNGETYFKAGFPGCWVLGPKQALSGQTLTPINNPSWAVGYQTWNYSNNIVCCVFNWYTNNYNSLISFGITNTTGQLNGGANSVIAMLGAATDGSFVNSTMVDAQVGASIFWSGNYDAYHNGVYSFGTNGFTGQTTTNYPASLWLTTPPSWWPIGTPWPCIGSDLSTMIHHIPSEDAFYEFTSTNNLIININPNYTSNTVISNPYYTNFLINGFNP